MKHNRCCLPQCNVDVDGLKRTLRWTWIAVAIAFLYAGTTLLLRWRETRSLEEEATRQRAEQDRKVVDQFGGGNLKVLTFYANPPAITKGAKGLLCYGVANAKSIDIEPAVEPVQPSLSRCVEVNPAVTTEYKLTAKSEMGATETRTVTVNVR